MVTAGMEVLSDHSGVYMQTYNPIQHHLPNVTPTQKRPSVLDHNLPPKMLLDAKSQFSTHPRNPLQQSPLAADLPPEEAAEPAVEDDVFYPEQSRSRATIAGEAEPDAAFANDEVSDQARVRSTHGTAGYRDGVAASKETHVQDGFDEGYALGAELGSRVGWILGVLEGLLGAVRGGGLADAARLHGEAVAELTPAGVYHRDYFQEDGLWSFELPDVGGGEAEEVTFRAVADAHPLVVKWSGRIAELAAALGVDLNALRDSAVED
jgi:hypothetical protein